tara:strand:+ start:5339 stop:7303 length:1965 start_codon:yes stop_codon:yes gene_type:complete
MHKFLFLTIFTFLFSQAEITNIQASQRTDGSKIVDITYDLLPDPVFEFFEITVLISVNGGESYTYMTDLDGDFGPIIEPGNGKVLTWDFGQQFDETYSDQIKIKIQGSSYAIIDDGSGSDLPFEMITIPAGEYTFGPFDSSENIDYDYEIMKYPVTDQDYVLYALDVLNADDICYDLTNSDGTPWHEGGGMVDDWIDFNCAWYVENECPDYGDSFVNDLGYSAQDACCDCGGGSTGSFGATINQDGIMGYYAGDANNPPGNYTYINFSDSKISWNDEIFEVEEGNVNHPVTGVTWFGAWAFALHYGMEVPDQYEWEKAARGNTGYDYPWGNDITINNANYQEMYSYQTWSLGFPTTPVGTFNGNTYFCPENNNSFNNQNQLLSKLENNLVLGTEYANPLCYSCDVNNKQTKSTANHTLNNENRNYISYYMSWDWYCDESEVYNYLLNVFEDGTFVASNPGDGDYWGTWTYQQNIDELELENGLCSGTSFDSNVFIGTFDEFPVSFYLNMSGGQCGNGSGVMDDTGYNGTNVDGLTEVTYLSGGFEDCDWDWDCGELITIDSPSPYGVYDMAGNVSEITKLNNEGMIINKGGNYNSSFEELKSWVNNESNTSSQSNKGFRCMRIINQSQSTNSSKEKYKQHHTKKKNNAISNPKK